MGNTLNFPVISPAPPSIKDEPAGFEMPTTSAAAFGQQFDAYRNACHLSPLSQMSPLSPQNRNLTPSPISIAAAGGAYTEQLCTLMQDSTIQVHDFAFNGQENHGYGYEASVNLNTYSNNNSNNNNCNTNYAAANANHFGAVRNTTSGGCFERINNNASVYAPAILNAQLPEPQLQNFVSEQERIEKIKMDLMQTSISLMQSPPQATVPLQNGWHENANIF